MAFVSATEVCQQNTFLHLRSAEDSAAPQARARSYSDGDIAVPMNWEWCKTRAEFDSASTIGSWADDTDASESTCCVVTSRRPSLISWADSLDESDVEQLAPVPVTPIQAQFVMPPCSSKVALQAEQTTVMLKNLPNKLTRTDLAKLIDSKGFVGHYDFIYVPIDFKTRGSFGYGLVNMSSSDAAQQLMSAFEGFADWDSNSRKVCKVEWAKRQGLPALLQHFSESKLMHEAVPQECKPAAFFQGKQVALPAPTVAVRQPNLKERKFRKSRQRSAHAA
jgi:hypothetical protein